MAFPMSRSAALGLAVSAAVAYGYSNIFVTASWPRYGRGCIQPCWKSSWQYCSLGCRGQPAIRQDSRHNWAAEWISLSYSLNIIELVLLCALSLSLEFSHDYGTYLRSLQYLLYSEATFHVAGWRKSNMNLKTQEFDREIEGNNLYHDLCIFRCTDSIPHNFSGLGMVGTCAFACLWLSSVRGAISWEFEHGLRVHTQRFWCLRDEGHMD